MKIFKLIRILQKINKQISKLDFCYNDCYLVNTFRYYFIDSFFDRVDFNELYFFNKNYYYLRNLYHHKYDTVKKQHKFDFEVNDEFIKGKMMEIMDDIYTEKYIRQISEKIKDEINYIIFIQIKNI